MKFLLLAIFVLSLHAADDPVPPPASIPVALPVKPLPVMSKDDKFDMQEAWSAWHAARGDKATALEAQENARLAIVAADKKIAESWAAVNAKATELAKKYKCDGCNVSTKSDFIPPPAKAIP